MTTLPLNVALVFDTSDSVAGAPLRHLQRAAHAFVEALDTKDRAAVITFSHFIRLRSDLTGNSSELSKAIGSAEAYGATAWYDALYSGLKTVEDASDRTMVLLFTDGEDTYSWLGAEQLAPLVRQSRAVVYAITQQEKLALELGENMLERRRRWRRARREHGRRTRFLRELTQASGGRLIELESTDQLPEVFSAQCALTPRSRAWPRSSLGS